MKLHAKLSSTHTLTTSIRAARWKGRFSATSIFIWFVAQERPDFVTINRFRNRVKKGINNIFTQVVLVLTDKGLIALDVEYIDGTKIEIKANKSTFVWRKTMEKNRAKLQEKKRALLDQIDDSISQDKAAETDKVDFTPEAQTSLITEL